MVNVSPRRAAEAASRRYRNGTAANRESATCRNTTARIKQSEVFLGHFDDVFGLQQERQLRVLVVLFRHLFAVDGARDRDAVLGGDFRPTAGILKRFRKGQAWIPTLGPRAVNLSV